MVFPALILPAVATRLHAQSRVLPKTLIFRSSPEAAAPLSVKKGGQVSAAIRRAIDREPLHYF
jgi:hypothetical protein